MQFESLHVDSQGGHRLHLMHIHSGSGGVPVLMVHGMIENGRIFYHHSGKGLGPFLAEHGFDVYVADLRGIGQSAPPLGPQSGHGQHETVDEDLPLLLDFVCRHSGQSRLHLVAHSWGGVYLNAALARHQEWIPRVISAVYFGSKRRVRSRHPERFLKIDLMWRGLFAWWIRREGFLDAVGHKVGADNESAKTHQQCTRWIVEDEWLDEDGLDVAETLRPLALPPTWYIAAIDDHSLGHRNDVRLFMQESGCGEKAFTLLSKAAGNARNYDHVSMLTAAEAREDHFPDVASWLEGEQL
ncbi:MAG: alpha/beta fold hydrolase [Pseudomonadota bacterium]